MEQIRKYPIGVQDFAKLREGNNLYVDKTEYLWRLVNTDAPYFLGRPRRFGKSLLLSTLKYYFQGRKDLFKGLAVEQLEKDWTAYPVFHLDFTKGMYENINSLYRALNFNLTALENEWGTGAGEDDPATRLAGLMRRAYEKTGRKVVVLVDEYDKPLLNVLDNEQRQDEMRNVLKGFYGVLKGCDQYLRFAFLTGVTKFSKVSIFSDLNQLLDISMDAQYAGICGISETELLQCFKPDIETLAAATNATCEETLARLKKMYDGYHFCEDTKEGMYNPFSVLKTFAINKFYPYWFETGTPTFLVKMLQQQSFDIPKLENDVTATAIEMYDYRAGTDNPLPLLYQSGYLTIKGYDPMLDEYALGFPNEEVKHGFLNELLPVYMPKIAHNRDFAVGRFIKELWAGDVEGFMTRLRAFFAAIPYELNEHTERYYQNMCYALFSLMGQFVQAETRFAKGRADMVVQTSDTVFVFEFKLTERASAEDALRQIDDKSYLIPFTAGSKKLVKIGAEFNAEERTISRWLVG